MKRNLSVWLTALAVAVVTFLLCFFQPLYTVDKMLADTLYQRPSGASSNIRIIAIDEKTLDALGPFNTWNRDISARLVEALSEDPDAMPAVIALDILYISDMDPDSDARFAEACRKAGNVITAANLVYEEAVLDDGRGGLYVDQSHIGMVEKPFEALEEVSKYGFANTVQDQDGYIRQAMAYADTEEGTVYSLAWQIYADYMEYLGEEPHMPELYSGSRFDFLYSGKSGAYETVSLIDVLEGRVDVRTFKDCIVMVGAYAPGMQDAYNVAVQRGEQMYGVEIHANIVDALLQGKTAQPAPELLSSLVMAAAAAGFFLLIRRMKVPAAAALLAVLIAAELLLGTWLFSRGWILHLISLPLVLIVVYAVHIIWNYLQERKRRQEVVNAFKKYVAPQVVDKVSKDGEFRLVLGGESSDERFATAKTMLDYGFANYRVYTPEKPYIEPIRVQRGVYDSCELEYESFSLLLEKGKEAKIEQRVVVEPFLTAPVEKGTVAGYLECLVDGELEVKVPLYTVNENPQIGFGDIFTRVLKKLLAFA